MDGPFLVSSNRTQDGKHLLGVTVLARLPSSPILNLKSPKSTSRDRVIQV